MAKLTKQQKILYGAIAAIAVFAVYLYLPSSTPTTTKHIFVTASTDSSTAVNVDPADDTSAHFPRYIGGDRDPFIPKVSLDNGQLNGTGGLFAGGKWQLTGINTIDGVTSAVIENPTTSETQFLKVGDSWNGLRVVSISDDTVNLVNSLGVATQLGFEAPADPNSRLSAGLGSGAPSVNQIAPLPPLSPGAGQQSFPAFQYGRGQ